MEIINKRIPERLKVSVSQEATQSNWVVIKVYDFDRKLVEFIKWENLPWHTRNNFDWFFKYKAALCQIKYPKYRVELNWGRQEPVGALKDIMLRNKIIAKKRKITEVKNKIKLAEDTWCKLFPIHEDIMYKKAMKKLEQLKIELTELESSK